MVLSDSEAISRGFADERTGRIRTFQAGPDGPPGLDSQLCGFGAPRPTEVAKEVPLIEGRMKMFPGKHSSVGSVKEAVATGCPAIVHMQMDSDQWMSTYRATIDERQPTFRKGREGKKMVDALFGAKELYRPPREVYVEPKGAPPTAVRDMRVYKHMGTLSKAGQW
ncbi:hypothetical protein AB1Y20_006979 [Prymnesium parvum]|uniref:Uncharacterized protein n=1 Tax=Prymnesium parvum TaxID=97485 RepID=A0AB34J1X0_PRYPA